MTDCPETPLLDFKLMFTKLGVESEFLSVPPEKLKAIYDQEGWEDPVFMDMYTKAYRVLYELYHTMPGHKK